MKNILYVNGIEVFAYHGVFSEENLLGQKFIFDIECKLNFKEAMRSDDLKDSVSYGEIAQLVKDITQDNTYKLLERLAAEIIKNIFNKFSSIDNIALKINKPSAPIPMNFRDCGIIVEMSKEDFMENLR